MLTWKRGCDALLAFNFITQGRKALAVPNVWRYVPRLCASMFLCGAALEVAMIHSGFYNVYSVNQAYKRAGKQADEQDFWLRVKARRAAKLAAGLIRGESEAPSSSS
eukprot:GHVT01080586.1.p1 GENE.GHVT01080586.1~~GHVT01080586.1.p1  ORF type:complete len:107 (-),score=7.29 GHVT01080586.1:270-590(-)